MAMRRFVIFLIFIFIFFISAFPAADSSSLPDILRWNPSNYHPKAAVCDSAGNIINPKLSHKYIGEYSPDIPDSLDTNRNWWHLFLKGKLAMNDTTVQWPKFLGFCVDVYRWGDRVFSSTDTAYVVGTGRRWRARFVNDNWTDSYYMKLPSGLKTIMSGEFHVLAGASLQYMAVSYTYSLDLSHLIGGIPIRYKKQEFGFNCARFSVDGYYNTNSGGTYIRTFGDYRRGHLSKIKFPGVSMTNFGIDAYYFFNGYKYSQGAAYNYSKIQKKSQGCIFGGFSYCNQDIDIDFKTLPDELVPYLGEDETDYRFHYHDYNFLIGYGYNWVINPHILFNITVIPSLGWNHCYENSQDGAIKLFSMGGRAMASLTYNLGDFFAGLQGRSRGHWYHSDRYMLFNTVTTIVLSAGWRF